MTFLRIDGFSLPKAGTRPEESQDAWACDIRAGRVAVADGASDAFESRRWAEALVQKFVAEPIGAEASEVADWLVAPAADWQADIEWGDLPYYIEEKAHRGTFATLLGLAITVSESQQEGRWHAVALGDTCLFHVRDDTLHRSFPLTRADEFGVTPALLSNRQEYSRRSLQDLKGCADTILSGDFLILATDAIAAALLNAEQDGKPLWHAVRDLTDDQFVRLVGQLRADKFMRNDDVTLVIARICRDDTPPVQEDIGTGH